MNVKELELTNRLTSIRNQRKNTAVDLKEFIKNLINKADSVQLSNCFTEYNDALREIGKAEGILEAMVQLALLNLPEYEKISENIMGAEARINYLFKEKQRLYGMEWRR